MNLLTRSSASEKAVGQTQTELVEERRKPAQGASSEEEGKSARGPDCDPGRGQPAGVGNKAVD